jgi:hypothetical protein
MRLRCMMFVLLTYIFPQVSSPELQSPDNEVDIQTEHPGLSSESSEVHISIDVKTDAANDVATTEDLAEISDTAVAQQELPIDNAVNTAASIAIDGDAAIVDAAKTCVVQSATLLASIPDTVIPSTEVSDNTESVLLATAAIVSSEAVSNDDATAAVAPVDDSQVASDDTIIVARSATEQSLISTAVPAVATSAATAAATVTTVITQVDAPTVVGTTDTTITAASTATNDVHTTLSTTDNDTLSNTTDGHASTTTVSDETLVIVSVSPESATAAATPAVTTPSTAAAAAAITKPTTAAPVAVAAVAAVAAAAAAASTYVIDGQALTLQHNAENAQAIEALLALVARLQMNTVSISTAATTEATTAAFDTTAHLTTASITAIPSLIAAATTVTMDAQAVPDVTLEHNDDDSVPAVHTDDVVLTTNTSTAVSNGTMVLTESNVQAMQQQSSDETATCVTAEMLPEAPTTAPVAIAFTTTANYSVQQQQQHEDVLSDADAADLADTSALNDAFDNDDNGDTEQEALQLQQQQQQQEAIQADAEPLIATTITEQSSMVHVRSISYTDEQKESDEDTTITTTDGTDATETADVIGDDTTAADIAALVTSMVTAVVLKSDSTLSNEATSANNSSTVATASHYDGAVAALTLSPERSVHEQLLANGTLQSDAVIVQTAQPEHQQGRRSLAANDLTVVVSGTTVNGEEQRIRRRSSMAEYLSSPTQALQQLRAPSDKQRARNDSECENTADSAVDPYREHLGDDFRKTPWKPPSKSIAREDQRYNLFRRGNAKLWKVTNLDLFVLGEGVGLYFVWLNYLMVFTAIATVLSIPAILIR